ncbi:hypothetical protein MLD38_022151 [Melastoma candidum]|uniref:Uncharacterized protein n=1 Tax=Melastoma candidum TaxID=119954 RepID=A0ACB9QIF5_9MYRT|nr:hypothetical protein MLD38_022151 [Melastoma candidum]
MDIKVEQRDMSFKALIFVFTVITCFCASAEAIDITINQCFCSHETISKDGDAARGDVIQQVMDNTPNSRSYSFTGKKQRGGETYWAQAECYYFLPKPDCIKCLPVAWDFLVKECKQQTGGRVKLGSCQLRFENHEFEINW